MHPFQFQMGMLIISCCGTFVGVVEFLRTYRIWRRENS